MPNKSGGNPEIHDSNELAAYLRNHIGSEKFVSTTLKTDERVIARVTDGIYRQPGSALRELIINAYDADATQVVINTDAPRFEKIEITDNGQGMSPEVLAHLLFHIGGSAKRHEDGRTLGITAEDNSSYSPKGRRLIGKIGIGLFSVSQLTRSFQIISKIKGDNFRTVATIVLKQYSDDDSKGEEGGKHKFESGKVNIWREKASDTDAHGTTIILSKIRPQARDTLQSREIWEAISRATTSSESDEEQTIEPPRFHVGHVDGNGDLLVKSGSNYSSLPWDPTDKPNVAFRKLVQSVWDEIGNSSPNPKLENIFDYYLRMIWQLSLAVPLPYVEGHLFDKKCGEWARAYKISNTPKGQAIKLDCNDSAPLRDTLKLESTADPIGGFEVFIDDLKLFRPIKYEGLPASNHAIKFPLIFLGKYRENFDGVPKELSGGTLDFEAYLFWTPKIAPVEHQGVLVRIHDASGTLFDSTFMRYQVSEQTRLRQITCEIFVREGLDSALNIDRESFNISHPHAVVITKWLHEALRQFTNVHKMVGKGIRDKAKSESSEKTLSSIEKIALEAWAHEVDESSEPPKIKLTDKSNKNQIQKQDDAYVYRRETIIPNPTKTNTAKEKKRRIVLEKKLEAIGQILASYGLLDAVPRQKQEKLLHAIYQILDATEE